MAAAVCMRAYEKWISRLTPHLLNEEGPRTRVDNQQTFWFDERGIKAPLCYRMTTGGGVTVLAAMPASVAR